MRLPKNAMKTNPQQLFIASQIKKFGKEINQDSHAELIIRLVLALSKAGKNAEEILALLNHSGFLGNTSQLKQWLAALAKENPGEFGDFAKYAPKPKISPETPAGKSLIAELGNIEF